MFSLKKRRLDINEEIQNRMYKILDYLDSLPKEDPLCKTYLEEVKGKVFSLESTNWIYNLRIDEELEMDLYGNTEHIKDDLDEKLNILTNIIKAILISRFNFITVFNYKRTLPEKILRRYPRTVKALNMAIERDKYYLEIFKESDNSPLKYPVEVLIEPTFLTIIFIY